MPRPMLLNNIGKTDSRNILITQAVPQDEIKTKLYNPQDRERILRRHRSKHYVEFLTKLDTGNVDMQEQVNEIIEEVKKEFPLIEIPGDFIGYCSKCYLGDDYEVHTVDFAKKIIEHYKKNNKLPDGMEKARYIAMDEHYNIIEVYTHCLRAIDKDGNVSVIEI